jgi:hypothetical protein
MTHMMQHPGTILLVVAVLLGLGILAGGIFRGRNP